MQQITQRGFAGVELLVVFLILMICGIVAFAHLNHHQPQTNNITPPPVTRSPNGVREECRHNVVVTIDRNDTASQLYGSDGLPVACDE